MVCSSADDADFADKTKNLRESVKSADKFSALVRSKTIENIGVLGVLAVKMPRLKKCSKKVKKTFDTH